MKLYVHFFKKKHNIPFEVAKNIDSSPPGNFFFFCIYLLLSFEIQTKQFILVFFYIFSLFNNKQVKTNLMYCSILLCNFIWAYASTKKFLFEK